MVQELFSIKNSIYVSTDFLLKHKIPQLTIDQLISSVYSSNKRWVFKSRNLTNNCIAIAYESIPEELIKAYLLPTTSEVIAQFQNCIWSQAQESKKDKYRWIKSTLQRAYEFWGIEVETYQNDIFSNQRLIRFCKTIAILDKCLELLVLNCKTADIYKAYLQFNDLAYYPNSFSQFSRDIYKIRNGASKEELCIEGMLIFPREERYRSEDIILKVRKQFCRKENLDEQAITDAVNQILVYGNRKPILVGDIIKIISQPYIDNNCISKRHKKNFVKFNYHPLEQYQFPSKTGEIWLINDNRCYFAYLNKENEVQFLKLFLIVDGASSKIIGYSFGALDEDLIKPALKMAYRYTDYLPNEIASFNSNFYNSTKNTLIKSFLKIHGVGISIIPPKTYSFSHYFEKSFGFLQSKYFFHCKGSFHNNFIDSDLNEDLQLKFGQLNIVTSDLLNLERLIQEVVDKIEKYNFRVQTKNESCPNIKFKTNRIFPQVVTLDAKEKIFFLSLLDSKKEEPPYDVEQNTNNIYQDEKESVDFSLSSTDDEIKKKVQKLCLDTKTKKSLALLSCNNYHEVEHGIEIFKKKFPNEVFVLKCQISMTSQIFYSCLANITADDTYSNLNSSYSNMKKAAWFFNKTNSDKLIIIESAYNFSFRTLEFFNEFYQSIRTNTGILLIDQVSLLQNLKKWDEQNKPGIRELNEMIEKFALDK